MSNNELRECIESLKKLRYNKVITEEDYALIVARIVSYQMERRMADAEDNN